MAKDKYSKRAKITALLAHKKIKDLSDTDIATILSEIDELSSSNFSLSNQVTTLSDNLRILQNSLNEALNTFTTHKHDYDNNGTSATTQGVK